MTLSDLLYWMAASMHVWVPPAVMALAALIIGCLHLVAAMDRVVR